MCRWVRAGGLERCACRRPSATPTRWPHTGTTGQCRHSLESTGGLRLADMYAMFGNVQKTILSNAWLSQRTYCRQVRAPAAVAGQRGAGRRGDALPPLHTPRHGGHAAHHPHRLHAVGAVDMCRYECRYYLHYLLPPSPGSTSSRPPPRCPRACGWPWWPGAAACR